MPEPPYVLLVDKDQCHDEAFWFQVGDSSRKLVSAIGCDKSCLIAKEPYTLTSTKAEEFNLAIHAWTERPEQEYLADQSTAADELEEMEYMYCHVGIQGVFTESVSMAVTAAMLPCDHTGHKKQQPQEPDDKQFCYDSADEAGFFTGVAAFVMGVFITTLFFVGYGRHYIRWQSTAVPSADDHHHTVVTPTRAVFHEQEAEDEHYRVAAAVEEWRTSQLATAVDEDQHGLELT